MRNAKRKREISFNKTSLQKTPMFQKIIMVKEKKIKKLKKKKKKKKNNIKTKTKQELA